MGYTSNFKPIVNNILYTVHGTNSIELKWQMEKKKKLQIKNAKNLYEIDKSKIIPGLENISLVGSMN